MTKNAKLIPLLITALILAGCNLSGGDYSSFEGYDEALNAKKLYAALDSAHFYMTDNATGAVTEEFTFMYRADDTLMYSYMGTDGDTVYYEFHNGSEINYKNKGDESWSFVQQNDENYYSYSRKNKHPYADEGVISLNAYALTDASMEDVDGGKKIRFQYDASKLAEALSDVGELQAFESTVWLNSEGYCCRLDQKGDFLIDGEPFTSDFSMFIDEMNEVTSLERPDV